ncbi:MAG: hypothetical protein JSU65_13030 [Candidatus Zixiibacteriota bacterium]|nr:MAG: hypothetical protein JSU65_13030 [candidate division Zixibacteria bacterium]
MPRHLLLYSTLFVSALLLGLIGCDDRSSGLPTAASYNPYWGDWPLGDHSYDRDLALQLGNPDEMWLGATYIPEAAMPPTSQTVPVLILLPPQDGDKFYYHRAGLLELAQELIATGEIEPMVIHCPANARAFGGMFYGNSLLAGMADSIISRDMLQWIYGIIPSSIETLKSKRGIGGVGMGAYGAFRAALKNTDADGSVFGSISVTDGPLDFDGASGSGGLIPLFPQALAEQPTLARYSVLGPESVDTVYLGNDTVIDTVWAPTDTFNLRAFDSGDVFTTLPLSRLFIGGSVAFSPHDTQVDWEWFYWLYSPRTGIYSRGGPDSIITDSSTMVDSLVGSSVDFQALTLRTLWAYHLPFDSVGNVSNVIWPLWMRNNLDSLYWQAGANPFRETNIWIANNADTKWNYGAMTKSWIDFLKGSLGEDGITVHEYSGIEGSPVTEDEQLYDLLREMLIFHSNSFEQ